LFDWNEMEGGRVHGRNIARQASSGRKEMAKLSVTSLGAQLGAPHITRESASSDDTKLVRRTSFPRKADNV
jgi:hypothetical protein